MIFSYYPGCTLKTKAKELDLKARKCAEALGITLVELPEWQCCGGAYSSAIDEIGNKLGAVRALLSSANEGRDLVTLCSACHNVLKRALYDIRTNDSFFNTASRYMGQDLSPLREGNLRVIHYLELLRDFVGFDYLKKKVKNPISCSVGGYYGCLLLRPSSVMALDDPESPKILEELICALGGKAVNYPYKNECCGGYVVLEDKAQSESKSKKITESALGFGASELVTACPLCLYNLQSSGSDIKISYFTELLYKAICEEAAEGI